MIADACHLDLKEVKAWNETRARVGWPTAGAGPRGPVHPEPSGLITWGRLDGGGYLCWVPTSGDVNEWPVLVLDGSLRFSAVHHMSASRLLLELATQNAPCYHYAEDARQSRHGRRPS